MTPTVAYLNICDKQLLMVSYLLCIKHEKACDSKGVLKGVGNQGKSVNR